MFYLLYFFFGASIGSFVQVVVTRLNVAPIVSSRSKCLSCGEALRVSDLVPVLSYLFLRGKCRYCKARYGLQALIVEICFGMLFVLLYHYFLAGLALVASIPVFVYYTLLFVALGVIALYDLKHRYVPLLFLGMFLLLSLLMQRYRYYYDPAPAVLLAPLIVALPFGLIWILSKGKALGLGDVILFAAVGAFFGVEQGLAVLMISVWLGAVFGTFMYMRSKKDSRKNMAIPFVPYIVAAFFIVLFTDIDIFSIASLFS